MHQQCFRLIIAMMTERDHVERFFPSDTLQKRIARFSRRKLDGVAALTRKLRNIRVSFAIRYAQRLAKHAHKRRVLIRLRTADPVMQMRSGDPPDLTVLLKRM